MPRPVWAAPSVAGWPRPWNAWRAGSPRIVPEVGSAGAALAGAVGVPAEAVERARELAPRAAKLAAAERRAARRAGARLVTLLDTDYPERLRHLALPPAVLYLRGELPPGPAVAIVGSRNADPYGLEAAGLFARALAGRRRGGGVGLRPRRRRRRSSGSLGRRRPDGGGPRLRRRRRLPGRASGARPPRSPARAPWSASCPAAPCPGRTTSRSATASSPPSGWALW